MLLHGAIFEMDNGEVIVGESEKPEAESPESRFSRVSRARCSSPMPQRR